MKNTFILTFSFFLLLGCNPKTAQKVTTSEPEVEQPHTALPDETEPPKDTTMPEQEPVPEPEEEKITLITSIKKTPCYGRCPVFEAKIYSDGTMTWYGKRFVDKEGHYEAVAPPDFMAQIQGIANEVQYFVFDKAYPNGGKKIADLPNTITYLNLDGKEQKIENNHDAPRELRAFEDFLMEMMERAEWKKIGG